MTTPPLKYVTEDEVNALRKGASRTRHKIRNELMVLMLYKHGLRGTELCRITLDQLDGCGYRLINKGRSLRGIQEYLGHRNIQNTVRYTELDNMRFVGFWD